MKTKEEIFSKYFHPVTEEDRRLKRSIFDFADEVADQQTKQLKTDFGLQEIELRHTKTLLESCEQALLKAQSQLSEKDKELSELKAKHFVGRIEQCNHVFQRVERGGEFQGNQCECGEWEDLT